MLIFRLFLVLGLLTVIVCGGLFIFTRNPRYLRFAWQTVRFGVVVLLVAGAIFLLERYVLVGWRVLL